MIEDELKELFPGHKIKVHMDGAIVYGIEEEKYDLDFINDNVGYGNVFSEMELVVDELRFKFTRDGEELYDHQKKIESDNSMLRILNHGK